MTKYFSKLKKPLSLFCTLVFAMGLTGTAVFADPATDQALTAFWTQFNKSSFPAGLVDAVECMVRSEDDVMQSDSRYHTAVLKNINAIFTSNPVNYGEWDVWDSWLSKYSKSPFMGQPPAYYGLLMLKDIAVTGSAATPAKTIPVVMTVVLCDNFTGRWPINVNGTSTKNVTLSVNQALVADDYKILRQDLRLFQRYIWGITRGELRLEIEFRHNLTPITFSFKPPNTFVFDNYTQPINSLSSPIKEKTDFWMVIYPDWRPVDTALASVNYALWGGMGGYNKCPVFIGEDAWFYRNRFGPGGVNGERSYFEVERRCYLPQWEQHEYFHHLYRIFPEFGLEKDAGHEWFNRSFWPSDFVGKREPDYYAESYNRRLKNATPTIAERLRAAPHWASGLPGNRAPVATGQSVSVRRNDSAAIALTGTDADGDSLTYILAGIPAHGTATGSAPKVTYTPSPNYTGKDTFMFMIADSKGAYSSKAKVSITVTSGTSTLPTVAASSPICLSSSKGALSYYLPGRCFVRLDYFDTRGRLVVSLIEQEQGRGHHTVAVPAARFSRGPFVRVFQAGSFKSAERIVVH